MSSNSLATPTELPVPESVHAAEQTLSRWGKFRLLVKVVELRLRFIALMAATGLIFAYWDTLWNRYDKWMRPAAVRHAEVSGVEYYCPMHPQVLQDDRGTCPICGMSLARRTRGEKATLPAGVISRVQLAPFQVAQAGIQTALVAYAPLTQTLTTVGYVAFDERRMANIVSKIPGKSRVETLYVNFTGENVEAGQPLAELYSPELNQAIQELLSSAERAGQSVEPRTAVARSLRADWREMARASAEKLKRWGITQAQIDEILAKAKSDFKFTILAPIGGHVFKKNVVQGQEVAEGYPMLELIDLGTVWVQAQVYEHQMGLVREGQTVEAVVDAFPGQIFSGKVEFIQPHLDPGSRTVEVRYALSNPGHRLRPGMFASVTLKTPVSETPAFLARVRSSVPTRSNRRQVSLTANEQKTCPVTELTLGSMGEPVAVDLEGQKVWTCCSACPPKLTAQPAKYLVRLEAQPRDEVLSIPESAVIDTGSRKVVYVEKEPGVFEGRVVVLGPRAGDRYPVLEGLAPGEKVAAAGAFLIDAESRLNPAAVAGSATAAPARLADAIHPIRDAASPSPIGIEPIGARTMIESIIEWSIRNRLLVILVSIVLALAGLRALLAMPVDAIPDLSENQVIVFTDWMGRSPQEIEDQVTYPLSVNLQGLAGVKVVRSSSEFNFSMITIIFNDDTDYYFARQRVLEKLSIASTFLPPGVTPYLAPDATAVGQIFWYTVESDGNDLSELRSIQDWFVRYQLGSVPGVAEVASVGGAPREYQIDLDPTKLRAYGISLGEVYSAVARSNSAVGGRVIHQGNAEYLIRSIGWIENLDDIRETVVAQRNNATPINVGMLGTVQLGPAFRRSVLEKNGKEVVGGVVLMRYGENPLEVTRRVKEKITVLQPGLPAGVRIVPFYDRTPLIHKAIETVSGTVKEELIVCTIAILLVMGHVGNAFVVALTLPLAILFSFLMMRIFGMSSNIMSLAGISISVGILIDQAVVMGENAAHHLTRHFGRARVTGDTTEIVIRACRTVGRPIFFSVLITILSFLPVFALSGREGKMFHPLAFTKTFALVGVALLSITLVPALIPIFLKGRIKSEDENWLVRTMIEIFKPMLAWLMDRTTLVCWLFVVILGLGYVASTKLGREFMPDLDEQSLMDMPTTVPRASIAEAARDLRVRDEVLRGFPEVWQVVGKAGRAETPTDIAPLDMIETVINLRDRELWPKRKLRYEDALAQTRVVLDLLVARGLIDRPVSTEARDGLVSRAAMTISTQVDETLRGLAAQRLTEFHSELGRGLVGDAVDALLNQVEPAAVARRPVPEERAALVESLSTTYGDRLAVHVLYDDVTLLIDAAAGRLTDLGVLSRRPSLLTPPLSLFERAAASAGDLLGLAKSTLFTRIFDHLQAGHTERLRRRIKSLNWELFDRGVAVADWSALEELTKLARDRKLATRDQVSDELPALRAILDKPFADRLLLWQKTKIDIVEEMSSALQMPGWGNSFTQPIAARIEMLSTGVRMPVAVKVFGAKLDEIQRVSQHIAEVLRGVRGAADVFPDQIVGKGYVEIKIDRKKAGRYGINVGDIQDVVEVAMGGRPLTMTVEGRARYPVRVRYARDYRDDIEALKGILVSARGMAADAGPSLGIGGMGVSMSPPGAASRAAPIQIPLAAVADIRVVEGPSMIKSENGLLRSYIQLRVRDRDEVGFVEEAKRVVDDKVVKTLPSGMYIEWTGTFEHQVRANKTLRIVFPAVIALIALILYITHKSWIDAMLLMTSVLGALAGGAIFQWLFGFNFSVAVQVGYIACFGMAVETGMVMLVYLHEAIDERGGVQQIGSIDELRQAILEGAVHRLRPKLLTEGAAILSIAPMLWATGVGAEVIRPMAAPVLGGLLIADEVIDVFLPVLYFAVCKRQWAKGRGLNLWNAPAAADPENPSIPATRSIASAEPLRGPESS